MLNLSELVFKVNTEALVDAANKVAALGKSVDGLSSTFSKLEKSSSQASKAQAKAEKDLAAAEVDRAKAAEIAAKTEERKAKAIRDTAQATEDVTKATKNHVSILERQRDINTFVAQGFTQGQASTMASAKAAGALADELRELGTVMKDTRSLIGGNTFDKSLNGLEALRNEYKVLTRVQSMMVSGMDLTQKQMKELALDEIRLTAAMKTQGKTATETATAIAKLNKDYLQTAGGVNAVTKAEKELADMHREAASANTFLEKEMQRVNFALQAQNNELNKGTANALNRFEQNLKRSGLTLDQQRVKMEEYRKGLLALEKTKGGNTDYITRALGPQITDIFVGLATGQAPLTVMLQQGGQLRDQFALAGVAAADMGATMRTAAKDMVVSVAAVARAFGDLLLGAFIDTGKGIVNLIGRVTGLTTALELARYQLTLLAMSDSAFGPLLKMFNMLRVAVLGFAAAAAATGVGALIAMAVGLKQVISENNELARSLALSGGSLAATQSTIIGYVDSLSKVGLTTGVATESIVEMAKAGVFAKDDIMLVATAAGQMATYAGVAVEDTVKQFAKLKEKPVEALLEIAKSTGMVAPEVLKMVIELEKSGQSADAAALAMKAYGDVTATQVAQMKENYNGFSLFIIELGLGIKQFFSDTFKTLFLATDPTQQLQDNLGKLQARIKEVQGNQKTNSFFGISADPKLLDNLKEQERQLLKNLDRQVANNQVKEQEIQINAENAKVQAAKFKMFEKTGDSLDKQMKKTKTLGEWTAFYTDKQIEKLAKEANVNKASIKLTEEEIQKTQELAKVEWDRANKKKDKKDPTENFYATLMRDAANAAIKSDEATQQLTQSQLKMLEVIADPRFNKLTEQQKSNYLATMAAAAAQEQQVRGQELYNKLLGKSEELGSEYYARLKLINQMAAEGFDSKKIEEMRKALESTTPAAKATAKYNEDSAKNLVKYKEAAQQSLDASTLEAQKLENKAALIGLSVGQQKLLTIEQEKQTELAAADFKLRKELASMDEAVRQNKMKPEDRDTARVEAERATAAEIVNINTKAVVDIQTAWQGVFDSISGGSVNRFAESLRDAGNISFANVISSVDKLSASMTSLVDTQLIYNAAKEAAKGDTVKLAAIDKQHALAQINSYANITGAMKGFFKEGSKGYKALHTAEKVFRAFEMAMAIKNAAVKIGLQLQEIAATAAAQTTMTSATATGEATRNAIKIPGVFTAFMSMLGPWGIPAAVAALAAVGLATSGGSAKVPTTNQGTGTVFGDPEAKSESIKNSLDVLKDVNTLTMHYSEKMLSSLRSIENLMGGVTNLILRSAGIDAAASGITEGTKLPGGLQKVPIIGKLAGKLFGTKTTITGQGVYAEDTKLNDVMSSGIESGYYVDVNKKKSFLGFSYSDKNSTNKTIDDQLSKQFTLIIKNFFDVIKSAAPVLGFTTDQIDSNLKDFVVKIGKIDLKGLSGKEIQEKLNAVFGAAGDDMAKAALPGFEKFQQVGEGYLETVVRVAYATESLRGMMDTLGVSTALTVDSAIGLVDTFGDLEIAMDKLGAYYDAFYTEAEKEATIRRQLNAEFERNNLELPKTRDEYKKLVEAQDLATEEGREMYAWLITLSPAFAEVTEVMKGLKEDTANLEIELLRAKGNTIGADAAQRSIDTAGMSEAEIAVYEYNQSIRDQIKVLTEASNLRDDLISLEGRFTGGGFSKQYKAEDAAKEVNSLLSSVGIIKDVATITSALLNSTTDEVQGYFREIWEVLDTDEARLRLVQVSNAMLDMATTSETAAEKFQKQSDNLSKLATEVSSLFAARNSAGNLLDKIAGAMGNQGSFAAQREGELWNALGSTRDYKKQVELASQLTDIVLERQQIEVQNAEKLLSFGQGLRDYVNGLKLSDLSPLTNAEKLAEASKQYSETLSKAIGGDANAQSGLQSISSSYLELARTYYAGNEQFSNIFNSVTSSLDTLGINSMTEAQQQIAIGNQSLEELQKLYGITETAYEALNTQYENSLSQLIAAQDALVLQASSLEQLVSISNLLTNLPAEIAVRLPTVNTALNPLNFSNAGATSDSSNAELLEELKLLRIQVAKLEASNREDARMQADVFVGTSQATADSIASATTKAARANEIKQGATIK